MKAFHILLMMLLLAACAGSSPQGPSDPALQALPGPHKELYRRDGTDFSSWQRLHVAPLEISYDRRSRRDPRYPRPEDYQLDERELRTLQQQLVKALAATWGEQPGWQLVDEPDGQSLTPQVHLRDFYLYAPLKDDYPGSSRTLTRESSRFLLDARLLAPDGSILLESRDRRVTGERGSGPLTLRTFSSVVYWQQAYQELRRWALQLRPLLAEQ